MRRKEKVILICVGITVVGTIVYEIIRQFRQKQKEGQQLSVDNFDYKQTLNLTIRNGIIGGLLGYAYYRYQINDERSIPFDPDRHLRKILAEEALKNDPVSFNHALSIKEEVKTKLNEAFKNMLASYPLDAGSFVKRTAISSRYDLDIILAFTKDSYGTLEEMYQNVYEILNELFRKSAAIVKNTKAIALSFKISEGVFIDLDVVPGREINNFQVDKELNLFVRPSFMWQRGSSFKTNQHMQRHVTTNKPDARNIIRLLKIYFTKNGNELPGVIIEQSVVEALSEDQFGIHFSMTENLLNAMNYLASKLQQNHFIDISNSNNDLNDKISQWERRRLSSLLTDDIEKVEENPRYLIEILE